MKQQEKKDNLSRRDFLKLSASIGVGLAIGATGMAGVNQASLISSTTNSATSTDEQIPFYGPNQAGIITPQQSYMYLLSMNITSLNKHEVITLFKDWTKFIALSTTGRKMRTGDNPLLPPSDTGETLEHGAARLTVTVGFGPSFFNKNGIDIFGIAHKLPQHLKDIPRMAKDKLDSSLSDGDVIIQVCAENQQVAFHAARNLIRLATGKASVNWLQEGFISGAHSQDTPRNLFGFKDGTANQLHQSTQGYDEVIWASSNEPAWMQGGTYLAYRKISMLLEVWDRSSLTDQEDTFGRYKESGAPYSKNAEFDMVNTAALPLNSHVRLAKESKQLIHRRAYSYTDGIDARTGNVNAGLLFISYQKNPEKQFIPMLRMMQNQDLLNEYAVHIASGMYACPAGLKEGQYIGQAILEG
ncbi:iron uptake transporter deferrochelatase/peroxidase subunit [Paenibacillus endoradicis]|uniref:iron uptake transporter deferrochelatase/peroxidase subunit n=1 Tax=Paenibacillus endoradicis TaxID=2972487 RepID=UPI002158D120|nr:iron uptake transporter deferrochelatase/peroxidase subunit [Paenibacillus endoradicis]MCR8657597.1 iron uptake transporter deferrochelatase/peroxidase subunit [Paenibacillus endoradicis]